MDKLKRLIILCFTLISSFAVLIGHAEAIVIGEYDTGPTTTCFQNPEETISTEFPIMTTKPRSIALNFSLVKNEASIQDPIYSRKNFFQGKTVDRGKKFPNSIESFSLNEIC